MKILRILPAGAVIVAAFTALAAEFRPPAGDRYALISSSVSVLPGGRILQPLGRLIETGPEPCCVTVSQNGTVATADTGEERFGITIIEPPVKNVWTQRHIWARTPHSTQPEVADPTWKRVANGIVFDSAKSLWVSEGDSGKVRQVDVSSGEHRRIVNLNGGEWNNTFTSGLASDNARHLLFVADRANSRIALIDEKSGRVRSSARVGSMPFAIALSPGGETAYVANAGSNSVSVVDVRDPARPVLTATLPAEAPGGMVAAAERLFVSNRQGDALTVIDQRNNGILAQIPLRIPSLEQFRGIAPAGMAYDPVTKWLLVAESGINAVGVIDTDKNELIGHIPAGWKPESVAIRGDRVYVANSAGRGSGPNLRRPLMELGEAPFLRPGSVTTFIMPDASEILRHTATVFTANGFVPSMHDPPKPPEEIKHVVLVLQQHRTFDEVLGDVGGFPQLARFGMHGRAEGHRERFSIQDARITPNQHGIAHDWCFSLNFYAEDAEAGAAGLEDLGPTFRLDPGVSGRRRADDFIAQVDRRYASGGEPFPPFVSLYLPDSDSDRYPYRASLVEDNDLALGRVLEYLSHSAWWKEMAVFAAYTEPEGLDHIDAKRTVLLAAGPYIKRGYVSHTNSDFAGLRRTIFEILGMEPRNLRDATAASLSDIFTTMPDFSSYQAMPPDDRIFDPQKAN